MTRYIATIFTNTGDKKEEWTQWNKDHVADMIKLPGIIACQAFQVRNDFLYRHDEATPTQPPYDAMNWYEFDDEGLKFMTSVRRELGTPPAAGTRDFPTPLGPYVGDSFLWESISQEFRDPGGR